MKRLVKLLCGIGLAAVAATAVQANEAIESAWYGEGGASSPYALISRDVNNDNSYPYTPSPEQWRDRNIYQLFTDRFATDGNNLVKNYKPAWDCEYSGDWNNRSYPFNRNYHHGGNWKGMRMQIPYLKGMGVTAVWISGVQQNDQGVNDSRWTPYHQYHVDNFFRCDPCMGTFQDLKDLIDALHAANIAVILDVAPNHMCDKNGVGSIEEDKRFWWDNQGKFKWWRNDNKHCAPFDSLDRFHGNGTINNWDQSPENLMGQFKGTDDLNQDDALTSQYLYMAFKNLIDATDCDGFRVDAIKHIPYDWCRNWAQAIRNHAAWRGKSNFLMFGELFSYDTGALASWCRDGYGFNSALLFPLMQAMNGVFGYGQSSYQLGEQMNALGNYGDGKDNVIAFLDNHDVNRFAMTFAPNNAENAKRIMAPAMTFLYLAPPVPLLYYGTEHMFDQGGHGNGSARGGDENPDDSDWQRECMFDRGFQPGNASGDMFQDWAKDRGLYYHIAWLNGLRNKSRALRRGGFAQRDYSGGQGLYAFTKWYDDEIALVVINTADYEIGKEIDAGGSYAAGDYRENGDGELHHTDNGKLYVSVPGKGTKIFIRNFVDRSDEVNFGGQSSGGGDQLWATNSYGFPIGTATTADTLWVNTEAGPAGVTNKHVYLVYGVNNPTGDWPKVEMKINKEWSSANGDWYHVDLGNLPAGTMKYSIAVDADGYESAWDKDWSVPEGKDFELTITQAADVYFQGITANPTAPDEGGSVTLTASIVSRPNVDVSAFTCTLYHGYGSSDAATTALAMTKSSVYTNATATGTNIVTQFSATINNLVGSSTLYYKATATGGGTTLESGTYSVKVTGPVVGVVGNCWHCPTNNEPFADVMMRSPVTPQVGWDVWLRMGNYQPDADMTGGKIWYRFGYHQFEATNSWGEWQSVSLGYETNLYDGNNNYWNNKVSVANGQAGNFLQYYFEVEYANDEGVATTYLFMDKDQSAGYSRSTSVKEAQGMPFEVGIAAATEGDEPGFIWHGGNTVRSADNSVQVWAKVGYAGWADEVVVRYRIDMKNESDGKPRSAGVRVVNSKKARGARSWQALTKEVPMTWQSNVDDNGGHGQAAMWMGTITDDRLLDENAVLIYEVYARNSKGTGNWKQAEYNAGGGSCTFEYRMWSDGSGDLTVDGVAADYTTSKFFIDEAKGETVSVKVDYHAPDDAEAVELFTNFGRRDHADDDTNDDGWPDGMIPPDGSLITAADTYEKDAGYWQAVPMKLGAGAWTKTLTTDKCGVYRITARYRAKGASGWTWYSDNGEGTPRRDHVVVISPKKAMEQTMYELNVLTTKATGTTSNTCGNFETLSERLRSSTQQNNDPYGEFSIDYLNRLGVNCLWFQPIHPNLDYERGNVDPDTNQQYRPGSPYATKNYFSVNKWMSSNRTETAAVAAFTNFVRMCDKAQSDKGGTKNVKTINVMLDGVMNHTSFDAVFGEGWALATNGLGTNAVKELNDNKDFGSTWRSIKATDTIPATKLGIQWYSHTVENGLNQTNPASYWNSVTDNDIANAPERYDFGKWNDVAELLYGHYSTMVRWNDMYTGDDGNTYMGEETSRIYSEEDQYYYNDMQTATKLLWKYMASYPEYWIKKTGNDGVNHPGQKDDNGVLTDDYGIDGLRCDYAQGLPNQFWEYCINRTRSMKWNFLFMAESLDGGKVGFRSNRQFDILNENMVFRFTQDHVSNPAQFASELESRRASYGNGLILLNLTCHDEIIPWGDPQATASRYAMVSAIDGVPMIFYGQEQSISTFDLAMGHQPEAGEKYVGFSKFESNFGKWIPNFKKWNRMLVWDTMVYANGTPNASRDMAKFYGRINLARQKSPALQSRYRWFLNDTNKVMFCAKWEEAGANPNDKDAVFAAVLFLNDNMEGDHNGHWGADCTYDISPFAGYMGIENRADKFYNLVNIASTDTNWFWEKPKSGKELYSKGLKLTFQGSWQWNNTTQTNDELAASVWTDNGNVVKFLKVYDVTDTVSPDAPGGLTINDPTDVIQVGNSTANYDVLGMAGDDINSSEISWSTGSGSGTFPKATVWTQQIALVEGSNVVTFSATTTGSTAGQDQAFNYASWTPGSNEGTGFGAWTLNKGDNSGFFIATKNENPYLDLGETAFGLWANSGSTAEAIRPFEYAMENGESFSVAFENGNIDSGGPGCGFALENASGKTLWQFYFNGGQSTYIHGANKVDTGVGYTSNGVDVVFTLTSATAFSATITPRANASGAKTVTGTLPTVEGGQGIARVRFWNYSCGEGKHSDVHFDNLRIGTPAGTITKSITIVRLAAAEEKDPPEIIDVPADRFSFDPSSSTVSMQVIGKNYGTYQSVRLWTATGLDGTRWDWKSQGTVTVTDNQPVDLNLDMPEDGMLLIYLGDIPPGK